MFLYFADVNRFNIWEVTLKRTKALSRALLRALIVVGWGEDEEKQVVGSNLIGIASNKTPSPN